MLKTRSDLAILSNLLEFGSNFTSFVNHNISFNNTSGVNTYLGVYFFKSFFTLNLRDSVKNYISLINKNKFSSIIYNQYITTFIMQDSIIYQQLSDIYTFFYHVGYYGGTFVTLSSSSLALESKVLNHYIINNSYNPNFLRYYQYSHFSSESDVLDVLNQSSNLDFVFCAGFIPSGYYKKKFLESDTITVGLVGRNFEDSVFDIQLPIDNVSPTTSYFFMEFCLFGYVIGARAHRKLLLIEKNKILLSFLTV